MEKEEMIRLVIDAQAGDADAMEKLLVEVHPSVSYQCSQVLRNTPSEVEDAIQEVLLTIYMKIGTLEKPEAFKGWVNQIAVRRCINVMNAKPKEYQFAETEDGHSAIDDLEELDQQRIPDAAIDNEETARMVQALIDRLPDSQRITVYFFYYDGLSVKQIAKLMGTTENTVKSRLNYARKAIKEGVLDYERKDGIKLYGLSPLPFLLFFLRRCAENGADPAAALEKAHTVASLGAGTQFTGGKVVRPQGGGAGSAGKAAGKAAAKAAGKASQAAGSVAAKVTAGIVAAAVAIGGTAYLASGAMDRAAREPEDTQAYIAQETGAGLTETAQENEPEPAETAENTEPAPVEETYTLLRTDVDTSAYNTDSFTCEIFLETPEFSGSAKGYPKINAFFEDMRDNFLSGGDEGVAFILERIDDGWAEGYAGFNYTHSCTVRCQTEQLVSVTISTSSFAGGATEYTITGYTFDAQTGELLELTDLVGGTKEKVRNRIIDLYDAQGINAAQGYDFSYFTYNDFTFYVEENQIFVRPIGDGMYSWLPDVVWPDAIRYGSDSQEEGTSSYTIVRTEIDLSSYGIEGLPFDVFMETPVFYGSAEGCPEINAFFQSMQSDYITREAEIAEGIKSRIDSGYEIYDNYAYATSCTVRSQTEQFVSVTLGSDWFGGYLIGYTFDAQTGQRLELTDLMGCTEEDVLNRVNAHFNTVYDSLYETEELKGQFKSPFYGFDSCGAFAFYVEENRIWIKPTGNGPYSILPAVALPDAITYVSGG